MNISFKSQAYDFQHWEPAMGRIFTKAFAFDCETTMIDEGHPWIVPAYVIGAAFDGKRGFFIKRADVAVFFSIHSGTPLVMHNAPFDLGVLKTLAPQIDIYKAIDDKLVWDTQLLHRLFVLGTDGHTAGGKGESSLEHCTKVYLGVELPKDVKDSRGDPIRVSYGQWLTRPLNDIEPVYLDYLAKDVVATLQIYEQLRHRHQELLAKSHGVWGFVSQTWLEEQIRKWGPQTHHIQLGAAIVLKDVTANGLHLDLAPKQKLAMGLEQTLAQQQADLRKYGWLPSGKGSSNSLQAIFRRLEIENPDMRFPRTEKGKYATGSDVLQDLAHSVPFLKLFLEFRSTQKLLSSFVGKMSKPVLHPSFNVLARTGRTTSFGEINAQNLPTDDRVRSCFVPAPGFEFIDADYKTIEMATLAQACLRQFNLNSRMAQAINDGKDLHTLVAAKVMCKPETEVTKDERKKAKPINFGKPGGMGDRTMQEYAKVSYGVSFSDEEVRTFTDAWFGLFSDMPDFLHDTIDTPLELAKLLGLTPISHFEHTEDGRFALHPDNAGLEHLPHRILGCMCIKAVKDPAPQTNTGKPYSDADLDYFWSCLEKIASLLSPAMRQDVFLRKPSVRLQREIMALVSKAGVFTFTGRLRAAASYCARHNTVFQGLAADGAKLALWVLWRSGYRIVNFVHDQVLIEIEQGDAVSRKRYADDIRECMIEAMKLVVPDILIGVSVAAADRWYKDAEEVLDETGNALLLWQPTPTRIEEAALV